LVSLVFYLGGSDPKAELATAEYAYRHYDYDQAIRFARRAALLGDGKTASRALALVADASIELGHPETAVTYSEKAIAADPACGRCYLVRGKLRYRAKSYGAAAEDFTKAFEYIHSFEPSEGARYAARRAIAFLRNGSLQRGCDDASFALNTDADSPLAHFALALCLEKRHHIPEAKEEVKKGYELGLAIPFFFSREKEEMDEDWLRFYTRIMLEKGETGE